MSDLDLEFGFGNSESLLPKPHFYCPYCEFSADNQLTIGDHVMYGHTKEHLARNARLVLTAEKSQDQGLSKDKN